MNGLSNYFTNKVIDRLFRGQALTFPPTLYFGLYTTAPTGAGGGVEVSGGSYARVGVVASLTNFSGTQGPGTTVASSGSSGVTSNNDNIEFPAPSADWGLVIAVGVFDAATAGNLICFAALADGQAVNDGDPAPLYEPAALSFQLIPPS